MRQSPTHEEFHDKTTAHAPRHRLATVANLRWPTLATLRSAGTSKVVLATSVLSCLALATLANTHGSTGTRSVDTAAFSASDRMERANRSFDRTAVDAANQVLAPDVERLSRRYPGLLTYESRNSAGLELNAALSGHAFGDEDLKAFTPLFSRLVRLDLSNTAVTDASARLLAAMPSLRSVRLTNSKAGDDVIAALASLKSLKSLTVTGSKISQQALSQLRSHGVVIYGDGDAR